MEYRTAFPSDVPALKSLWAICFGDEADYIDRFFEDLFLPEHMAVCADGTTPVSMVAFLPCTLRTPTGCAPWAYLYAMATHPKYQGRGLGQNLLRFAWDYARRNLSCDGLALVPADRELFRFYAKTYYQTAFAYQPLSWDGAAPPQINTVRPISPEEYRQLREHLLREITHLDHSLPFLSHLERETKLTGGGLFCLELSGGESGCAVLEQTTPGHWCAKELLTPKPLLQEALAALAAYLDCGSLTARTPVWAPDQACPFGMACCPHAAPAFHNAYLGLALD